MKFTNTRQSLDLLDKETATLDEIRSLLIDVCVYETDLEVYRKFISKTSFNYVMASGETPLTVAVINNSLNVIKFLVENGADIMGVDGTGTLPYDYSIISDRKDVEDFLFYPTLIEMTKIKDNDIEQANKTRQELLDKRKNFLRGYSEED